MKPTTPDVNAMRDELAQLEAEFELAGFELAGSRGAELVKEINRLRETLDEHDLSEDGLGHGDEVTHEINLNGKRLMGGDRTSARVIFRNISGENFNSPPAWKQQTHSQYMASVQHLLQVEFKAGDVVSLHSVGNTEPERRYTLKANDISV